MNTKRNVLILTDGSGETAVMAAGIAAAVKGNRVTVKTASEFRGNDILPAEVIFLGCEKPRPGVFAYLEDLLKHINLAGRPCGVFTPGSEKTARYLAALIKDTEAALHPEFLLAGTGVKKWTQNVFSMHF